jgi:nucleoside-diphosphate-sugar epimerase
MKSARPDRPNRRRKGIAVRMLVAGAAGFIGSHLADRFLSEGNTVIGVDNLATGRRQNLARMLDHPDAEFVEHDLSDPLEVRGDLDWILHFASPASPPKYLALPVETLRVNSEGTRHLLDLARQKQARFFLASTSEVYGDPHIHPQPESYWGNVNSIGPRSVYDEAKRYAEALTMAYARSLGVDCRIIRIFNTYGPRMDAEDGRVVTNFVVQALRGDPLTIYGDGTQTRSFQYVDDLIEGICRLMRSEYHGPVNLGNPQEFTMVELALLVKELTGTNSELEYRPLPEDDPRQRRPDITLARELLRWEPRIPVREGLARTIAYFRSIL